jgi:hypothetical protein
MKYSIQQIAAANEAAGGFFFSKESMKFFNQTRRMFKMVEAGGRMFIYAPSYWDGRLMGYTFAEVFNGGEEIRHPADFKGNKTLKDIMAFIADLKSAN